MPCLPYPFLLEEQNAKSEDPGHVWDSMVVNTTTKKPLNSVCMCVSVCFIKLLEELLFLETGWKKS